MSISRSQVHTDMQTPRSATNTATQWAQVDDEVVFVNGAWQTSSSRRFEPCCYSHSPPDQPIADYNRARHTHFHATLNARLDWLRMQLLVVANQRDTHFATIHAQLSDQPIDLARKQSFRIRT